MKRPCGKLAQPTNASVGERDLVHLRDLATALVRVCTGYRRATLAVMGVPSFCVK